MRYSHAATTLFMVFLLAGQFGNEAFAQRSPKLISPDVHPDGRVTLRIDAPSATEVRIVAGELEGVLGKPLPEPEKTEDGPWEVTLGPLPPGIYDYRFSIDGAQNTDPNNPNVFGNRYGSRGYLEIPGPEGKPRHDEWRDVPHGTVSIHWYQSSVVSGARRRLHVYTPPGYVHSPERRYPVLYLLHGSGDNDSHWTVLGQANVIADNLIADGVAEPMVIVMPDGHVPISNSGGDRSDEQRERANSAFEREMLSDIIPLVESHYRVSDDSARRAITGLSMGGGQSLRVGLGHADRFAWIGGFSSSTRGLNRAVSRFQELDSPPNLLWIRIGKDDFLLDGNREFIAKLKEMEISYEYRETEGAHRWSVWRRYLADFLPRLFRE